MTSDPPLILAILRAVGERGTSPSGYARPEIDGYARGQIDAAVDELRRGGYLDAAHVGAAFGDNPAYWAPSVLTPRGRRFLEELQRG